MRAFQNADIARRILVRFRPEQPGVQIFRRKSGTAQYDEAALAAQ